MDSRSKCSHSPSIDGRIFTCPACAWRAVVATDGRMMQTQAGEPGHDHIGQARAQLAAIRAEAERACEHLRRQLEQNRLQLRQYQFLIQHVIAEYAPA